LLMNRWIVDSKIHNQYNVRMSTSSLLLSRDLNNSHRDQSLEWNLGFLCKVYHIVVVQVMQITFDNLI
jgi:hypothetical protein